MDICDVKYDTPTVKEYFTRILSKREGFQVPVGESVDYSKAVQVFKELKEQKKYLSPEEFSDYAITVLESLSEDERKYVEAMLIQEDTINQIKKDREETLKEIDKLNDRIEEDKKDFDEAKTTKQQDAPKYTAGE
jgi:hypothetical protein